MDDVLISLASNILGYEIAMKDNLKENGMDSLSLVSLIVDIEETFNINFNDDDLDPANMKNLDSIAEILKRYL